MLRDNVMSQTTKAKKNLFALCEMNKYAKTKQKNFKLISLILNC